MYIEQGHKVGLCLKATQVASSSYYYRSSGQRKGRIPSKTTATRSGEQVSNSEVVEQIGMLLSDEFVDYGYIKVTHWLRKRLKYKINKKKVYRLMKEYRLLNSRRMIHRSARLWVSELVPKPERVFEHLEIDIKYIYVHGTRRNIQQLTVLDVRSRYVLGYVQGYSIRKEDVIELFKKIFQIIEMPSKYYVRMDNGSQFVATTVRDFFASQPGAIQEFTRPSTPEQNGHIEAFHSIIERSLTRRYCFENAEDLGKTMRRFISFYNTDRIHSGIDYDVPLDRVKADRPDFEAVWVVDHFIDKPLLGTPPAKGWQ